MEMHIQRNRVWLRLTKETIIVITLMVAVMAMFSAASVSADNALPLGDQQTYGEGIVSDPGGDTILESLANLVGGIRSGDGGIVGRVRGILGAIAIAMIVFSALQMILAQGEETKITNAKKGIYLGLLGLGLVSLAGEITKILSVNKDTAKYVFKDDNVLCQYADTFLGNGTGQTNQELTCRVNLFNNLVKTVITFMKYLISGIAVYEVITSAYRIITLGSESSDLERDKKNLIFGGVGLAVIIFSESIISKVFYKINFSQPYSQLQGLQTGVDINEGVKQIASFTNIAVSILGPLCILVIIGAAIMYMTSAGDEEKQKKATRAIFAAAIGTLVVYGAFGIVSTVISGKFQG